MELAVTSQKEARLRWLRAAMAAQMVSEIDLRLASGLAPAQIQLLIQGKVRLRLAEFLRLVGAFELEPPAQLMEG